MGQRILVFAATCPACFGDGVERSTKSSCGFCGGEGYVPCEGGAVYHEPKNLALFMRDGVLLNPVTDEHWQAQRTAYQARRSAFLANPEKQRRMAAVRRALESGAIAAAA